MKKTPFLILFLTGLMSITPVFSQSSANYTITVTTTWNAANHGSLLDNSLPNDPHWSPLALVTHKNPNAFLQLGAISSEGVQNIAEFGGTASFQNEVNAAINIAAAHQYLQSSFTPRGAISSASINITVTEAFPLVTFLSMVAPSPDWFIAVNSESLRSGNTAENRGWKDTYSLDLFAYDAGTDDGLDYQSANSANNPKVGIFMINSAPINGIKIAAVTFTLNETLSTLDAEVDSKFSVFPNPVTKGKVYVTSGNKKSIERFEIYSILGRLIKKNVVNSLNSTLEIDVSNLKSGVYILKLNDKTRGSLSQKIIVK